MIQSADSYTLPAALPLEEGGLLVNAHIAYQSCGDLAGENSIVLLHDLTHSHLALGAKESSPYQPSGWAGQLVGEGKPLNPQVSFIVSPNLLGSPFGSTSPSSRGGGGQAMGASFPALTLDDLSRGVAALLRGLKIRRVRALAGVGLGGMVALRTSALFPELAGAVIAVGAARSLPEGVREDLALTAQLLKADPGYRADAYLPGQGPLRTLKKLRLDLWRRMVSRDHLAARFSDPYEAERHLEEEAQAFAASFDGHCYATLSMAYARADLTDCLGSFPTPVLLIAGAADAIAPPSRVRDTYHLLTAGGCHARYYELQGQGGHATLLEDGERLKGPFADFLARR